MEIRLQPTPTPGPKKILFASVPADGHVNPMTGLALHLKNQGYEVRWYTSRFYAPKMKKLGIHHYPFETALEVEDNNFDKVFPERAKIRNPIRKLRFDMINAFIRRGPEYYQDLLKIREEFAFDLLVADCAFVGIPFVKDLMKVPVVALGIMPLIETSRDLAPAGLGMVPASSPLGRLKQSLLRAMVKNVLFGKPHRVMYELFDQYQIPHQHESIFDMNVRKSDLFLQSGSPGFEYERSDISAHIHFIGSLLPAREYRPVQWTDTRLREYRRIVLVTQGTVEKDTSKIIEPTLEAFAGTDTLVVATTGGSGTEELRRKYSQANLIIEDYIPFGDIMPYAGVYITNGGYGGVMLGIQNELPMLVAGINEGKNEICARVGYFQLGINLKTERPASWQIRKAVDRILADPSYRVNVQRLSGELRRYQPGPLMEMLIEPLLYGRRKGEEKRQSAVA